jgi:hypothetical protein
LNAGVSVCETHNLIVFQRGFKFEFETYETPGNLAQDGRNILKCWEEKCWVAPSCRGNISDCLAVVTGGSGWGMYELPQQAFLHNMPLAFATAAAKQYVPLNRDLQSLLYWWTPDASFIDFDPERVLFPTHDAQEFRRGIYRSMPSDVVLTNWAAGGLDSEMAQDAEGPLALASNMQLFNSDMVGLLKEMGEGNLHYRFPRFYSGLSFLRLLRELDVCLASALASPFTGEPKAGHRRW